MVFRKSVRMVFFIALGLMLYSGALFAYDIQQAKQLCDQGNFQQALDLFMRISNQGAPQDVKEARYYIGFCKVRLQDFWGAVAAFENFLGQYEMANMGDNFRLIPDAYYVLGRTYEQVNNLPGAAAVYQKCCSRFPGGEFSAKCQERLRILGPVGPIPVPPPPPGPVGPVPPPPAPPCNDHIIDDIIRMARAAPSYAQQDEILLSGLNRAQSGIDALKLAQAAASNNAKDEICLRGVAKCRNTAEIVQLAHVTASYAAQDRVCLAGLNCCMSGDDILRLAQAAASNNVKDQILITGVPKCHTTPEVVQLARATATYAQQDQVCLQGMFTCRTGMDVLQLAGAAASNNVKDQVLMQGVSRCISVDEVIQLAHATATYAGQDQICLAGVRMVRTFDDATRLANAAASSAMQQRVLDEARKILLGGPCPIQASVQETGKPKTGKAGAAKAATVKIDPNKPKAAPKGAKPVAKKEISNPFEIQKIDQDRLTRINGFLASVENMKDVEGRQKHLKPTDLSLDVVKSAMRKYSQKKVFEKAHGEK